MNLNLDKGTWKRVTFGDVVKNLNVTVKDAESAGIQRVIAMEHLDPGELQIKRWGDTREGTTFTRRVRPRQTLFGKRRAYQRKAAYAEFDAICSGDILVFEAESQQMYPEFLPFLVQSDGFYGHALGTSAGSLSPRTNWRDLANYEFDLPPLDEQRRIAALMWAYEQESTAARRLLDQYDVVVRAWADELFRCGPWPDRAIGDLLEKCQYGLSTRAGESGKYPMLRMTNLDDGKVTDTDLKYCDLSVTDFDAHRVIEGDVLFNRTNSVELVGRSGVFRLSGDFVFASYLVRLRTIQEMLLPDYLNLFINSPTGQRRIRKHLSKGVSQANISAAKLKTVPLPVPPLEEQERVIQQFQLFEDYRAVILERNLAAASMRKETVSQVFGDAS